MSAFLFRASAARVRSALALRTDNLLGKADERRAEDEKSNQQEQH
jgi:hypothetical protein